MNLRILRRSKALLGTATAFYKTLNLFNGIGAIRVVWASEAGQTGHTLLEVPKIRRKAWVGQLSACKAMQGLLAQTRRIEEGSIRFEFSHCLFLSAGPLNRLAFCYHFRARLSGGYLLIPCCPLHVSFWGPAAALNSAIVRLLACRRHWARSMSWFRYI